MEKQIFFNYFRTITDSINMLEFHLLELLLLLEESKMGLGINFSDAQQVVNESVYQVRSVAYSLLREYLLATSSN